MWKTWVLLGRCWRLICRLVKRLSSCCQMMVEMSARKLWPRQLCAHDELLQTAEVSPSLFSTLIGWHRLNINLRHYRWSRGCGSGILTLLLAIYCYRASMTSLVLRAQCVGVVSRHCHGSGTMHDAWPWPCLLAAPAVVQPSNPRVPAPPK